MVENYDPVKIKTVRDYPYKKLFTLIHGSSQVVFVTQKFKNVDNQIELQ
jgi:hypothetical protein